MPFRGVNPAAPFLLESCRNVSSQLVGFSVLRSRPPPSPGPETHPRTAAHASLEPGAMSNPASQMAELLKVEKTELTPRSTPVCDPTCLGHHVRTNSLRPCDGLSFFLTVFRILLWWSCNHGARLSPVDRDGGDACEKVLAGTSAEVRLRSSAEGVSRARKGAKKGSRVREGASDVAATTVASKPSRSLGPISIALRSDLRTRSRRGRLE